MSDEPNGRDGRLGSRFLKSSVYLGVGNWFTYALNFVINIAVARLLGPADFGAYALVFAINEFIVIGAFSLNEALIHNKDESRSLYDTANGISAMLGLAGMAITLVLAPILAHFRSPEAAWFLVVLGLARILNLLSFVPHAMMERRLRYGPIAVIGIATGNVPNLCALVFAWIGFGAWSLIWRDFLTAALTFILVSAWSGYRFRLALERGSARSLMDFSRPVFVAKALDVLVARIDRLAVGVAFGDVVLGLYHQARYLAEVGMLAVRPVMRLSFNLYSRVRHEPPRLSRSFGIINYFLARFMAIGAIVLVVFPEETIRLLLAEEWIGAAPILRMLGLYAVLLPLFQNLKQLLFARGMALKSARVRLAQAIVFLPMLAAASYLDNVVGVAVAVNLMTVLAIVLASYYNGAIAVAHLRSALLAPALAGAATLGLFQLLANAGYLKDLPWQALPFLPPIVFLLLLVIIERGKLFRELGYLRRQFRGGGAAEPASGAS